jgi:NAD(P)-dependent dehydrogenase (short-subunit alcohol dehydrogenase family)
VLTSGPAGSGGGGGGQQAAARGAAVHAVGSQHAGVGFAEGLRIEAARAGVSVTVGIPGLMRTGSPRNAPFTGDEAALLLAERCPSSRSGFYGSSRSIKEAKRAASS